MSELAPETRDRRRIVVYIAGPYRANSWGQVLRNVGRAMDVAADLLRMGYSMICPHSMTHGFEMYGLADDVFLDSDLVLLEGCDVVFCLDNSALSLGTQAEIARANELGIPVMYTMGDAWKETFDLWVDSYALSVETKATTRTRQGRVPTTAKAEE